MKKIFVFLMILFMNQVVFSQETDSTKKTSPPVTITGSIDAYYKYDFNNPKAYPYNSLTSFTRSSNSFELGMASIRADHSFGKVSATIDLGFGTRAEEFAYNDANTRLAIKQLYVTYAPSSIIKFTLGTWELDNYLSHDNELPLWKKIPLRIYFFLKRLDVTVEEGYNLDYSLVTTEKVPLLLESPNLIKLGRIKIV